MLSDLQTAMQGEDSDRIRQLTEQLQQASYALSQQLNQAQAGQAYGNGTGGHTQHGSGDDVVEGEFQEM